MAVDLEKYRKQPTTTGGATPTVDINKYRKAPVVSNQPTFDVPVDPAKASANRLSQYQSEQGAYDKEAGKGFFSRFGKALIKNIAPSEVGLGKTISGILLQGSKTDKGLQESISTGQDTQVQLLKAIRENEAKGADTTRLKTAYNELEKTTAGTAKTARDLVQLPTNVQAAGQIGGTALDLLTAGTYSKAKTGAMGTGRLFSGSSPAVKTLATAAGAPELGNLATQKAGGLFSLRGAGNIAKGAGIGYATDVAAGAQGLRGEDREGAKAFIPGLGTALGAGIPALSEAGQTVKNIKYKGLPFTETRTMSKRNEAVTEIRSRYSKTEKAFAQAERRGVDIHKTLAETNLLNGAVDNNGLVKVDRALENFNEFISPYEGQVKEALAKEGKTVNLNNIVDDAVRFIDDSKLSDIQKRDLQRELASNLEAFKQFSGDNVPLTSVQDTKTFLGSRNNYLVPSKDIVDKEAARFFKELIEKNSTIMDVGGYNAELSKYYAIRDAIESLDKTRVLNGRAGKYFASVVGGMIGATSGNPIIALAGAEAGSQMRGAMMGNAFGGNLSKGLQVSDAMLNAQNPLATGKAAIPNVVIPKSKSLIGDLNLGGQSSKSSGKMSGSLKITQAPNPKTKATINTIPKNVTPKVAPTQVGKTPAKGLGTLTPKQAPFNNPKIEPTRYTEDVRDTATLFKENSSNSQANASKFSGGDKQYAGKVAKGIAMADSAVLRKMRGEPTGKEINTALKYLNSNHVGKEVIVQGQKGVVQGTSFGKIRIKLPSGNIKSFDLDEITAKKSTSEEAVEHLKKEATKQAKSWNDLMTNIKKPNSVNNTKKTN